MVAWFAFAVILTAQGAQFMGSSEPYATKEECMAVQKKVEDTALKVAKPPEGVLAYHLECIKLSTDDFKKPGLDA